MAQLELDYMEYSSDALAQAAYVTNGAGSYDVYTKLCSHFDGTNGATAYTDPIAGAYTFPASGCSLDTAQKKFGTASLLCPGANAGYITQPDSASWYFGTGDFTIEAWVMFDSTAGEQVICGQYADNNNRWVVLKSATTHKLYMVFVYGGVIKGRYTMASDWSPSTGVWYHLEYARTATSAKMFINGVNQALVENDAFAANDVGDVAAVLSVGAENAVSFFKGRIDELRISVIARHSTDFTPPVLPYPQVLQCFSEATIKTQGSYSLKGIAIITNSLNKTFTKTLSPVSNLSLVKNIKFDIRASRTGSNIKIGIYEGANIKNKVRCMNIFCFYSVLNINTY